MENCSKKSENIYLKESFTRECTFALYRRSGRYIEKYPKYLDSHSGLDPESSFFAEI